MKSPKLTARADQVGVLNFWQASDITWVLLELASSPRLFLSLDRGGRARAEGRDSSSDVNQRGGDEGRCPSATTCLLVITFTFGLQMIFVLNFIASRPEHGRGRLPLRRLCPRSSAGRATVSLVAFARRWRAAPRADCDEKRTHRQPGRCGVCARRCCLQLCLGIILWSVYGDGRADLTHLLIPFRRSESSSHVDRWTPSAITIHQHHLVGECRNRKLHLESRWRVDDGLPI